MIRNSWIRKVKFKIDIEWFMPGIAINGELCDSEGLFLQELMSSLPIFQQQLKNRAQTPKEKLAGDWKAIP